MGRNGESVIMEDCGVRDYVKQLTYLLEKSNEIIGKFISRDDMLNDSSTRFTDYSVGELKDVIEVKYFLERKFNNKEKEIEALQTLVTKQQKEISGLMGRNGESVIMKDCDVRDHVKHLTYLLEKSNKIIGNLTQILENSAASLPSSDHFQFVLLLILLLHL